MYNRTNECSIDVLVYLYTLDVTNTNVLFVCLQDIHPVFLKVMHKRSKKKSYSADEIYIVG